MGKYQWEMEKFWNVKIKHIEIKHMEQQKRQRKSEAEGEQYPTPPLDVCILGKSPPSEFFKYKISFS